MLQPIHAPLPGADRITNLTSALVTSLSPRLMLTSLAVRRGRDADALVIVYLTDGGREPISADEARRLARELRSHPLGDDREAEWAESLDKAAEQADRQASAILLGMDVGAGVTQPRHFGSL